MDLRRQWASGTEDELAFWRSVFAGEQFPAFKRDLEQRADANAPLMPWIAAQLPIAVTIARARILDVGAGPVSCVGWQLDGGRPQVVAVDPLADRYRPLLDAARLAPPVYASCVAGEELARHFGPARFDVVHLRNALDQCWDPVRALRNVLAVLRPGGSLLIHGDTDAAERAHGRGLHLWNLRVEAGELVIRRGARRYGISRLFARQLACTEINQDDAAHWTAAAYIKLRPAHGVRGLLGGRLGSGAPRETAGHRRQFLLDALPMDSIGAEVGVLDGNFSRQILDSVQPRRLYLIDPWRHQDSDTYKNAWYGGKSAGGQAGMDERYRAVLRRFRGNIRRGQVEVRRGTSAEVLAPMPNDSLDWIYIDGNHLYEYVRQDLQLALAKVRPGGYIAGDDYTEGGWWAGGVKRAVDELTGSPAVRLLRLRDGQFIFRKAGRAGAE